MSDATTGTASWRGFDEFAATDEVRALVAAQFPSLGPKLLDGPSRRQFLKLMGASMALAGLTACRWPREKLAPFAQRPEGHTPGAAAQYATAMELGGVAQGLLVTSHDGRPIKIEGNPAHPLNRGATDAFAQASVLELYDPDRAAPCRRREGEQSTVCTWDEFAAFVREHFGTLRERGGVGLAVLSELSSSPSLADLRGRFMAAFPQAHWHVYEPISRDNERTGTALLFGTPHRPQFALNQADVIVCLEADLLGRHPAVIKHTRDFVAGRDIRPDGRRRDNGGLMNRLYVIESAWTVTGGMADQRIAVRSGAIAAATCELLVALRDAGLVLPAPLQPLATQVAARKAARVLDPALAGRVAADLLAGAGRGVLAAGAQQPPEVHALVHALNLALHNAGNTVSYTREAEPARPTCVEALGALVTDIRNGVVDTLLTLGGNPAHDAPVDLAFAERLASVKTSIHLGLHENETSRLSTWRLARAHYLESWGDTRAYDGTLSIVQPLIEPLYGGRTPIEVLALILGEAKPNGYEIVRRTMGRLSGATDFESFWRRALHDGLVAGTAWPTIVPPLRDGEWGQALVELCGRASLPDRQVEVAFTPDHRIYDGRFANNGWLQELPDPLTKLTWDNAALMAPATAETLDVETGDVIRLEFSGRRMDIAAFVQPGQAPGALTVALGYGRTAAGRVGDGVGFNAYELRTSDAMHIARGATVTKLGRRYELAVTQDHHAVDSVVGRREKRRRAGVLVREAGVDEYVRHPDFARQVVRQPPPVSLWRAHEFPGQHHWAMAIDLNRCTGCSTCVVACQAENNVPVVGKDEVQRGREMQWLRVDRYFTGAADSPHVVHQPIPCQQCENAPCEQVCPVAATVHSREGLNDMVYNRCVGTRYCSNNCPFKVRRFNWFNNWAGLLEVEKFGFNPQVTVRSRGVMEKCTYCVQRISAARIAARNEGRTIADGEIAPACAQACPAGAIVFGDLSDPHSRVAQLHADDRAYALLAELNTKPRTKYLARLRNPPNEPGTTGPVTSRH